MNAEEEQDREEKEEAVEEESAAEWALDACRRGWATSRGGASVLPETC